MATTIKLLTDHTLLSHSTSTATQYYSIALSTMNTELNKTTNVPSNARITNVKVIVKARFEYHGWAGTMRASYRFGLGNNKSISKELLGSTKLHTSSTGDKKGEKENSATLTLSSDLSPFALSTSDGSYFTVAVQSDNVLSKSFYIDKIWLEVTHEIPSYTITVKSNNTNYGTASGGGSYNRGSTATLTATAKTGYTFSQWNDGEKTNPRNITVTGDATYTAQFTENKYTIAFNGNGSTGGSMSSLTNVGYDDSKALTANAFTKTGYTFNGWNTKADGSGTSYADKATVSKLTNKNGATVTLYAKWKANSYTINFNANGGSGSMSDLAMTYDTAKNLTANSFTRTGYDFLGWSTSNTATTAKYVDKASVKNLATSGTVTLYAIWKVQTYTITVKSNNDSYGTVSGSGSYNYGDLAILIATPATGCKFVQWNDGATSTSRTVVVTENVTYTAVFEKITATIWRPISNYGTAILYNKNGEDVSEQLKFNYGEELTLVFVPKEQYKFINFTFNGQNNSLSIPLGDIYENPITFSVIDSGTINISVVCQEKETYGVTLENIIIYKQDGNIVNEEGVTYTQCYEGTVLELKPDLSEPMHQFVQWSGDISGTEIPKIYTVTKDSYLRAVLKEVQMKFKSVKIFHHSTNETASSTNPLIGGEDQAIIKVEIALE